MPHPLRSFLLSLSMLCLISSAHAQWTLSWSSPSQFSTSVAGWLDITQSGSGNSDYRFYTIDSTTFRIMAGENSSTPQYSYPFTAAERFAGNYVYSLGLDLTGDGVVEFYVLASYGTASPYRQSVKIFNIVNGAVLFEKNDTANSYSYPSIWDVDGDGLYECTLSRTNYPAETQVFYEIYDTGIAAQSSATAPAIPRALHLAQNYPNPFNPSTRIDYQIDRTGYVQIDILNVLGEKVQSLVNQTQAAGSYTAEWNGQGLSGSPQASGPYYYQLRVSGQPVQTRPMLLVR